MAGRSTVTADNGPVEKFRGLHVKRQGAFPHVQAVYIVVMKKAFRKHLPDIYNLRKFFVPLVDFGNRLVFVNTFIIKFCIGGRLPYKSGCPDAGFSNSLFVIMFAQSLHRLNYQYNVAKP